MTQDELIEDLREQVAYWKSEALGVRDASRQAKLQAHYGLSPQQAELLDALYAKRGDPLDHIRLDEALTERYGRERTGNSIEVQIVRLRKRLGADFIETVRGRGWRLSQRGIEEINRLTES